MKFDEILEKVVKEISEKYDIPEREIWITVAKFRLKQKLGVR
ncbi:MAG: hypothetical protein QW455_04000 [Archaeoglobaceae archaeon]